MSARAPSRKVIKIAEKSSQQNGTGHLPNETDPELQHDVDIHFPRQPRPSATTRSTVSSGKTRKSKKSETATNVPLDPSNVVLSRGRPMKPHETEPFLTIDNLPPEKTFVSEKSTLSGFGTPRNVPNKPQHVPTKSPVLTQLQRMSVYMSPYSRDTPGAPSPSVVSGNLSPNKVCKSPTPNAKPRPNSGSRPNTGTKETRKGNDIRNRDLETEAIPKKILKESNGTQSMTEENIKENVSRPSTGSRMKIDSRPSTTSKSGSRPGTGGSRSGRLGSGIRQRGMRSLPSRTGRVTPANTPFQSPNKQLHAPNHHVKSPFKHYVSKPDLINDGRNTPSMGMKERTALAAYHINKMISVAGDKDAHKVKGRLQKGKLKPLYPVAVEGPTIDKCRGIISETRSYGSSPSRTLQRRLHLMNTIPNVHEYLYDRPRTVESVHRTSVASSIDDDYEADDKLPDEIIYPPPKTGSILEPRTPENTFVPIQEPTEILEGTETGMSQTVFATELSSRNVDDINITTQLQQSLVVNDENEQNDHSNQNNNNSNNNNSEFKSAEEIQDDRRLGSANVRGISSSKSVRFADDGSKTIKEIKQITNNNIAMQQRNQEDLQVDESNEDDTVAKKNKQNLASCKSDELKELRKQDKDSDDEDADDNKKTDDNKNGDNAIITNGEQSGNSRGENSDKDKPVDKDDNDKDRDKPKDNQVLTDQASGGKDNQGASGVKYVRKPSNGKKSRSSKSGWNSRPSSGRMSTNSDRQKPTKKGQTCSKFEKSPASKTHTHKLEVSSVVHGTSVQMGLRPESPSRCVSPSRQNQMFNRNGTPNYTGENNWYNDVSFDFHGDNSEIFYNPSSTRSKVKFLLENEEPEIETIFVEDEEDVKLKQDTQISFDTLEAEIMSLRMNIQHDMNNLEHENGELSNQFDQEINSDSETLVDSEEDSVTTEMNRFDTVRGDYTDILEKYRQQCMNRSEKCGAISTSLITPRETGSVMSSSKNSITRGGNSWHLDANFTKTDENSSKSQVLSNPLSSDSGHGSVENLSEFSRSASISVSEVPRLDLGGSTSDLDIESGRSEVTVLSGNTGDADDHKNSNILEMVCEQLSPLTAKEQKEDKANRKEEEEDVTKLKVVATTKSLSKSKRSKLHLSTNKAPYPPLCFTINARPPAGYLYYFAYGPDMNPDRFKNYIMRENVSRYWGLLFGFNLIINKKGTSEEAGGFSNIEFNPLRSVEGCLYKITPQELQVLDKCIGYPEHYQHLVLPVWMSNSHDPDSLGVAQYCVPALMYIAQNKWTERERTLDHDYSLSQCIKSADLVTKDYRDSLVAMATQKEGQMVESVA